MGCAKIHFCIVNVFLRAMRFQVSYHILTLLPTLRIHQRFLWCDLWKRKKIDMAF